MAEFGLCGAVRPLKQEPEIKDVAVVTLVDILGIQRFVYATNRLRDVVGGSELVDRAASKGEIRRQTLASDDEVIFGAGGNLLLCFKDETRAREFAGRYSRWLMDTAPGLEACIVHEPYQEGGLKDALIAVRQTMQKAKMKRLPAGDLLGLGVDEPCIATGLPANYLDKNDDGADEAISHGVWLRRDEFRSASAECPTSRKDLPPLVYPAELDKLGRSSGEISLMGVVHIDGNGIGQRLNDWLAAFDGTDEELKAKYGEVSEGLSGLASDTFAHIREKAVELIEPGQKKDEWVISNRFTGASFSLYWQDGKLCAPIRPILVAGDDLTFVCDGRLALALAAEGLRFFEQQEIPYLGRATACAGVALVKTHAPFVRAYELSEALCRSAKKVSRANAGNGQPAPPALDWQINLTSPSEIIESLRERPHGGHRLTCRPYLVESPGPARSVCWKWMEEQVLTGQKQGFLGNPNDRTAQGWHRHRNKMKQFPELALSGPGSVSAALAAWQVAHGYLKLPCGRDGFEGGATYLLDAVELLDVYYPLK